MNAAAKALAQGSVMEGRLSTILITRQTILVMLSMGLLFISAFAVIYERMQYHELVTEMQQQNQWNEQLQMESKQLLLEQVTWSTPHRVQTLAERKLNMQLPQKDQLRVVSRP